MRRGRPGGHHSRQTGPSVDTTINPSSVTLSPWKRSLPARREYRPKPLDPGQRIEWTQKIDGEAVTRQGTIWSDGPVPSSLWVLPDDDRGRAVAVKLPGKRDREWGRGLVQLAFWPAGWAHDAIWRAESVRRHGSVYAVAEETREVWGGYTGARRTETVYLWHADPGCPAAAGKDRGSPSWPAYSVHDVVDILIGRKAPEGSPPFCRQCIYLESPATIDRSA